MKKLFYNGGSIRMPRRSAAEKNDEYTIDGKGIEECPECKNVYHNKRWMSSIKEVRAKLPEAKVASAVICPACKMIKEHLFEGEIIIEHVPEGMKDDLMGLIHNSQSHALEADPQDRIISLEEKKDMIRITTTENQMADRMGKKIKSAMKNAECTVTYRQDPYEVTRVHITFPQSE